MNVVSDLTTFLSRSIHHVFTSPFSGGGYYRLSSSSNDVVFTNILPFGAFRKEIFQLYGNYNERLLRSEDLEFWRRLKSFNVKLAIIPNTFFNYHLRTSYSHFLKHGLNNGFWVIWPIFLGFYNIFSFRHFVPFLFALYFLSLPFLSNYLLLLPFVMYLFLNLYYSFSFKLPFYYMPINFFTFFIYHLSYGFGSLIALLSSIPLNTNFISVKSLFTKFLRKLPITFYD